MNILILLINCFLSRSDSFSFLRMKLIYLIYFIGHWLITDVRAKWVRDVDSKIIDEIQRNPSISYLIKFHAPWSVN